MGGEAPFESPDAWTVVALRELTSKIGSGATPTGGGATYLEARHRFALVRSQNVFNRHFDTSGLAFISDEQAARLRGVELKRGDLLLNITGDGVTFGRACMVPEDTLPACVNQHVAIVRVDPKRADARFVLAYLTHPSVKHYIESFNAGGSRRAITKAHIESFAVPLPPLPTQSAIGRMLGSLDDKIQLGQAMNGTLAALGSALFVSWFVDFDPVHAKRDGLKPVGVPEPAQVLFPSHFEDSAAGPIPAGWKLTRLADCGTWVSGGTPSKQEPKYWGGDIPWISARSLHTFFLEDSEDRVTTMGAENGTRLVPKGSVLFLVRGMSLADEFRFGIAGRELVFNQDVKAIVPREDIDGILLALLLHHETDTVLGLVDEASHGTKRLQTELVEDLKLALPPLPLRRALAGPLVAFAERQLAIQRESNTLRALRDALIGPLLSGEITLKAAEKAVSEVA